MGIAPRPPIIISNETTLGKDDVAAARDPNHYNMEEAKESNGKKNSAEEAAAAAAQLAANDKEEGKRTVRNMHENIPLTKQHKHDVNDIDTNREHHNVSELRGKLPRGHQSQLTYSVGGNTREGMLSNEGSV